MKAKNGFGDEAVMNLTDRSVMYFVEPSSFSNEFHPGGSSSGCASRGAMPGPGRR